MSGEELKKMLKAIGISLTDVAGKLGMSKQNLNNKLQTSDIGLGFLTEVATAVNKNVYYFIDNSGELKETNILHEDEAPYYVNVNAAAGLEFLTDNSDEEYIPVKIPNVKVQGYINVFGDSMYPKYCSGEVIGVKLIDKDTLHFGHAYVIRMSDGEAYIKYIDPGKDDNHWVLRSENEKYKPREFHLSKIDKIFIIKVVINKTTLT